jgi:hypothetical protein
METVSRFLTPPKSAVIACAFFFGPYGPSGQPGPTTIQTAPKPDFAFLFIYAILAFLPPSLETPAYCARHPHRRSVAAQPRLQ